MSSVKIIQRTDTLTYLRLRENAKGEYEIEKNTASSY